MPNSNIKFSFNIDAWAANSPGLSHPAAWQEWATTSLWPEAEPANVSAIPPMMRRRMSPLSKLAVQTAIELLNLHSVDYLVFASRHGELHRSMSLIEAIIAGEDASPMAFSQSVHNTSAGLATIATKKAIPLTSIAATEDTFQSALIEAWLFLSEYPDKKVLVIDFDQPLPEVYQAYETQQYPGYSLGLVLSSGAQFAVETRELTAESAPIPQGLTFLQNYLLNKQQWTINGSVHAWQWQQKCKR